MTILNETTELIQEGYTWGISYRSILPFILGGIFIIFGIKIICNAEWKAWKTTESSERLGTLILIICIFIVGLAGWAAAFHAKPTYKEVKQYEVTISPFTPFRMIYDNYDIIEQRGDIFILRDKDWENND